MIKSMTGFGKGTEKSPYGTITAEIKSLNHKSLSVSCAPYNGFFLLEEKAKGLFEGKIFRGHVFIKITTESAGKKKELQKIETNEEIAREYLKKIKKVQKQLGVGGDILIQDLIGFPGVVESSAVKKEEKLWPHIRKALRKALESLIEYRKSEGARLARDFKARLRTIQRNIREIKKYEKQSVIEYRGRLVKAIQDAAANMEMDRSRLEEEVALFARNCDIAEEITRLEAHIKAYKETLDAENKDVGKKLDFIAQEMQREANTIGSKSSDFRISQAVIEVKAEIEKMREQIKNIE